MERRFRLLLDLFNGHTLSMFYQSKPTSEVDIEHGKLGDDPRDTGLAGQRELALLENLRVPLLISVLHGDDHLGRLRIRHQIHGAAEALDLAGKHPVGEISFGADLHCAEDSQIDLAAADHGE